MSFYIPLHNFFTTEETFNFSKYLSLECFYKLKFKIEDDGYIVSKIEYRNIVSCHNWLIINNSTQLSEQEILNTLLLAFWIQSSNKIKYKYIFNDNEPGCEVMLNRFQYNKVDKNKFEYTLKNLRIVKEYFMILESITLVNGRLHSALSHTFQGCISLNWATAYLLYSAAIETMITYKRGIGITKRLAKSYACLVETDLSKRKQEYDLFNKLYNIRSEIIHGQINNSRPDDNLINLSKFVTVLRRLWQTILSDSKLVTILEKQDLDREAHLRKNEKGFNP